MYVMYHNTAYRLSSFWYLASDMLPTIRKSKDVNIVPFLPVELRMSSKNITMNTSKALIIKANDLDERDPLRKFRSEFDMPEGVYFCGNSLGPMPLRVMKAIQMHMNKWSSQAVGGHFSSPSPWASIEQQTARMSMPVVGAAFPHEVAVMNSLTVNLHLMLTAFYRPSGKRRKILVEDMAFSSDEYAVQTHVAARGFPNAIVRLAPPTGNILLSDVDIVEGIRKHADELALVLLPGVQYYTGQLFPMADIVKAAHAIGVPVGFDLAHAVGNIPLRLHDWGVDFAVWCTYKYINAGPGAVAGLFIHDNHAEEDLPRHAGWWGHDPETRHDMPRTFKKQKGAWGFQISNLPVLSLVPVTEALTVLEEAGGMEVVREKSLLLTGFLEEGIAKMLGDEVEILSPKEESRRGCQLSLRLKRAELKQVNKRLAEKAVACDVRRPDVLRVAPAPLFNTFREVVTFLEILQEILHEERNGSGERQE